MIVAFGDDRFSQPFPEMLVRWDFLNDTLAISFQKKYMYIFRACRCCIKGTNSFFEFSDRAPMHIKSFIISNGHPLITQIPANKYNNPVRLVLSVTTCYLFSGIFLKVSSKNEVN